MMDDNYTSFMDCRNRIITMAKMTELLFPLQILQHYQGERNMLFSTNTKTVTYARANLLPLSPVCT